MADGPTSYRLGSAAALSSPLLLRYGPHPDQQLCLWRAAGAQRGRPLAVFLHGGGWASFALPLDAALEAWAPGAVKLLLARGISLAAIGFRGTPEHPLPAPVRDAARAIQYLRANAAVHRLDTRRIIAHGLSAGGCTALWLALHPDLARPDAADPVERESTRLLGAFAVAAQTSIDPPQLLPYVGRRALEHSMIPHAVGEANASGLMAHYGRHRQTLRAFSPAAHASADDPPVFLAYARKNRSTTPTDNAPPATADAAIHHWGFGALMRDAAQRAGGGFASRVRMLYFEDNDVYATLAATLARDVTLAILANDAEGAAAEEAAAAPSVERLFTSSTSEPGIVTAADVFSGWRDGLRFGEMLEAGAAVCPELRPTCCRSWEPTLYACRDACREGETRMVTKSRGHSEASKGCRAPPPKLKPAKPGGDGTGFGNSAFRKKCDAPTS